MVVETLIGRDPDMIDQVVPNEIHPVVSVEERVLASFVPHIEANLVPMGFVTGKRGDEVIINGKAVVKRSEHPQNPGTYMTELAVVDGGVMQPLVRIAPVESGEGVEVFFYDRYASQGMVPLEVAAKENGYEDIPQPVKLGDPSRDNRYTKRGEEELVGQVTSAVNQVIERAANLDLHLRNKNRYGTAVPRPEDWQRTFVEQELLATSQVVYDSTKKS